MTLLVIILAALVLLLMILNARLLFTPRVSYYVVQPSKRRSSHDGCLPLVVIPLIIGLSLIVLGGL